MIIETLTDLQYVENPGKGPWQLYVFDRDGFHKGGKYFQSGPLPPDLDEDERKYWITREAAKDDVIRACRQGLEVRITDGGDRLVYHAIGMKQMHPTNANKFWSVVGG
jgi:hypothetical protein